MVWYSHLLTNIPICCDAHKGFSVVHEAEADDFLPFSCFFSDPTDVGNLISDASAFSKSGTSEVLRSCTIEA